MLSGMWLASPCANNTERVMNADCDGRVYFSSYSGNNYGFRPIVCLKSNSQLEENGSEGYCIVKKEGSATDVFNNPSTYYGKVVTGYEVGNNNVKDAVDTWRIFHSDGDTHLSNLKKCSNINTYKQVIFNHDLNNVSNY